MSIFKKVELDDEYVDLVYNLNKDLRSEFRYVDRGINKLIKPDCSNKTSIKEKGNHTNSFTIEPTVEEAGRISPIVNRIAQKYKFKPYKSKDEFLYAKYSKNKEKIYTMSAVCAYSYGILTTITWIVQAHTTTDKLIQHYNLK